MPSKNIYQATQIVRKDSQGVYRTVYLRELSWVFDCPVDECEYIMTALSEENAEALQHMHFVTMPETHLDALREENFDKFELTVMTQDDVRAVHGFARLTQ